MMPLNFNDLDFLFLDFWRLYFSFFHFFLFSTFSIFATFEQSLSSSSSLLSLSLTSSLRSFVPSRCSFHGVVG